MARKYCSECSSRVFASLDECSNCGAPVAQTGKRIKRFALLGGFAALQVVMGTMIFTDLSNAGDLTPASQGGISDGTLTLLAIWAAGTVAQGYLIYQDRRSRW